MSLTFKFNERPYSGKTFRPKPEIHLDRNSNLLLVVTPWGPRSSARRVIDRMLEYFLLAKGDNEVTSPFERLTCLSPAANLLRTAALLANEMIYREENRHEYKTGVEIFAASFFDNELVWLQLGQPQIMLSRANGRLLPIGGYLDLSLDLSEPGHLLPALPNQLLGLDSTVNLTINGFRAQPGDKVILLSHSSPPPSLYTVDHDDLHVEEISSMLAKANPDIAFWVGVLELENSASTISPDADPTLTSGEEFRV